MRGAAAVLLREHALVSGSDRSDSSALGRLREQGAKIRIGQSAGNLPDKTDVVVYSAAIKESNPELIEARRRGARVLKYAELLGLLMSRRVGIAIAGTHGKSTTTAMLSYILREAKKDPTFVIGAGVDQLGGGSGVGDGEHFVVEACEFDRSYLSLRPTLGAILNLEEDHLDYYSGLAAIIESFHSFGQLIPRDGLLVVNGEDRNVMRAVSDLNARIETFGFEKGVDWQAEIIDSTHGCFRFRVVRSGERLMRVQMGIPGRHMVADAMAAIALAFHCGVEPDIIAEIIGQFRGAHRRMTRRGCIDGVTVVDDYGHHPTEIQVTLKAAKEFYAPRKMFVVFQPHQHSRTRFLLNDFARIFGSADVVIVPDIYFVRDSESERDLIDATDLVERIHANGGEARYEKDFAKIAAQLCAEVEPGDLVVTMGAGDVWKVADHLLGCLDRTRGQDGEILVQGDSKEF